VTRCDPCGVKLGDGEAIEARSVVWAAGVRASPAGAWLDAPRDAAGRVTVGADLALESHRDIFVIGDAARVSDHGKPVPGVAPAAKQQGDFVGRLIAAEVRGAARRAEFRYRDPGSLATIGRKAAVANLNGLELTGLAAWLVWSVAHVFFLIGFRNRLAVTLDWIWSYLTFERGARLITGVENARPPVAGVRAVEASPYLS
jgi:NADH dehydrogenase